MYSKRKAMRKHKSISAVHHVERNLSNFVESILASHIIDLYVESVKACESFYLRDVFLLKGKEVYLFIPIGFPYVQVGYRGSASDLTESVTESLLSFGMVATAELVDVLKEKRKHHDVEDNQFSKGSRMFVLEYSTGHRDFIHYSGEVQCYG